MPTKRSKISRTKREGIDWSSVPKWQAPSFEFRRDVDGTWLARTWRWGEGKGKPFVRLSQELIDDAWKEYGKWCYGGAMAIKLLEEQEND